MFVSCSCWTVPQSLCVSVQGLNACMGTARGFVSAIDLGWRLSRGGLRAQETLIAKLAAGAQSGRAASAEKQLEKMRAEGLIEKPFVPKKRSFTFPSAERMGQRVLSLDALTHGYQDRTLFKNAQLELEKGDRVAIIGKLQYCMDLYILAALTSLKPLPFKKHRCCSHQYKHHLIEFSCRAQRLRKIDAAAADHWS